MNLRMPPLLALLAGWCVASGLYNAIYGSDAAIGYANIASRIGLVLPTADKYAFWFTLLGVVLVGAGFGMVVSGIGVARRSARSRIWAIGATGLSAAARLGLAGAVVMGTEGFYDKPVFLFGVPAIFDVMCVLYLLGNEATEALTPQGQFQRFAGDGSLGGRSSNLADTQVDRGTTARDARTTKPETSRGATSRREVITTRIERGAGGRRPETTQVVDATPAAVGWLVERTGTARRYALQPGRNVVGRDPNLCQVVLTEPTVSREHAVIACNGSYFEIQDLLSTGGITVNGKRVSRSILRNADEIRLGRAVLVFSSID